MRREYLFVVLFAPISIAVASEPDPGDKDQAAHVVVDGAATPKELIERAAEAIKRRDEKSLAACFVSTSDTPERRRLGDLAAQTHIVHCRCRDLDKMGRAKFGAAAYDQAIGERSKTSSSTKIFPDLRDLAARGVIRGEGRMVRSDITAPNQLHIRYQSQSMHKRDDGRWYLWIQQIERNGGIGDRSLISNLQLLREFLDVAEPAIEASRNIREFTKVVAPWRQLLSIESEHRHHIGRLDNSRSEKRPFSTDSIEPNRRAAEWVIYCGGRVGIDEDDSKRRRIHRVEDLPNDAFTVYVIEFATNRGRVDMDIPIDEFANLAGLRDLKSIDFTVVKITDEHLKYATDLESLEKFVSYSDEFSGDGLGHLKNATELKVLWLTGDNIANDAIAHLRMFPELHTFWTKGRKIDSSSANHLVHLEKLRKLYLSHNAMADDALEVIGTLDNLEHLSLNDTRITDMGIDHLAGLHHLTHVDVSVTDISGQALSVLARLPKLTLLRIDDTRVADEGFHSVAKMKRLQYLSCTKTSITDDALASLSQVKSLTRLDLADTVIGDAGVEFLRDSNLASVILTRTRVTDECIPHLIAMKRLRVVHLHHTSVTEQGVQHLKSRRPGIAVYH